MKIDLDTLMEVNNLHPALIDIWQALEITKKYNDVNSNIVVDVYDKGYIFVKCDDVMKKVKICLNIKKELVNRAHENKSDLEYLEKLDPNIRNIILFSEEI